MSFVPEILDNIFSIQKTQEQYVVKILGIRIKKTIYSGIDYAICRSISSNVGEEVQWISAMRFVPEHFVMINSQNQSEYKPKKQTKLIKNGWYTLNLKIL